MRAGNRAAVSAIALLIGAAVVGWDGSARAERTIYYLQGTGNGLAADRAGNLYGTAAASPGNPCCDTIYRLIPPTSKGQSWTEQTLYSFPASRRRRCVPAAASA